MALAETTPSDPKAGEDRDLYRNLVGILAAGLVFAITKIGFELPQEVALAASGAVMMWVSKKLAGLGKRLRQSESPTGITGQIF